VAGVPALSPGQSVEVTRTLEPGSYVFLRFFPDPEGTPHAALGMYELFTIAGDSGAALPEPDATITATDAGLQLPTLVPARRRWSSRTVAQNPTSWPSSCSSPARGSRTSTGGSGAAIRASRPVTFLGGMQTIPASESVFLTIDLEPAVEYTALDFTTNSRETFTVS
jgi:hypothetical protein